MINKKLIKNNNFFTYIFLILFFFLSYNLLFANDIKKIIKEIQSISKTKNIKENNKTDNSKESNKTNVQLFFERKITVETVLDLAIEDILDCKEKKYIDVQGFCTDGQYFYVAVLTKNYDNFYLKQKTKLIKIDIKTKEIVADKDVGNIGHSNSLTYNPKTKSIYIATCSKLMLYIVKISNDFSNIDLTFFRNLKNDYYDNIQFLSTITYDKINNLYITKVDNYTLACFDSNFIYKKEIKFPLHIKINDHMNGQAISCIDNKIFSVCNDFSKRPVVNHIIINEMDGKRIKDYGFSKELVKDNNEVIELEQVDGSGNECYGLANVNLKDAKKRFRIYRFMFEELKDTSNRSIKE